MRTPDQGLGSSLQKEKIKESNYTLLLSELQNKADYANFLVLFYIQIKDAPNLLQRVVWGENQFQLYYRVMAQSIPALAELSAALDDLLDTSPDKPDPDRAKILANISQQLDYLLT